jgi:hypothetical protein
LIKEFYGVNQDQDKYTIKNEKLLARCKSAQGGLARRYRNINQYERTKLTSQSRGGHSAVNSSRHKKKLSTT